MTGGRYRAVQGSQSSHCCFEATVVDTTQQDKTYSGDPTGYFVAICECFELADAERIAAAMNAAIKETKRAKPWDSGGRSVGELGMWLGADGLWY